jgi:hypothetical protein
MESEHRRIAGDRVPATVESQGYSGYPAVINPCHSFGRIARLNPPPSNSLTQRRKQRWAGRRTLSFAARERATGAISTVSFHFAGTT